MGDTQWARKEKEVTTRGKSSTTDCILVRCEDISNKAFVRNVTTTKGNHSGSTGVCASTELSSLNLREHGMWLLGPIQSVRGYFHFPWKGGP